MSRPSNFSSCRFPTLVRLLTSYGGCLVIIPCTTIFGFQNFLFGHASELALTGIASHASQLANCKKSRHGDRERGTRLFCSRHESIAHQPTGRRDESDWSWGEAGQSQGKLVLSVGSSSLAFSPTPRIATISKQHETMKNEMLLQHVGQSSRGSNFSVSQRSMRPSR